MPIGTLAVGGVGNLGEIALPVGQPAPVVTELGERDTAISPLGGGGRREHEKAVDVPLPQRAVISTRHAAEHVWMEVRHASELAWMETRHAIERLSMDQRHAVELVSQERRHAREDRRPQDS